MDVHRHLPLAPRDLLIMAALLDGPLHGYGIIKAVEARSHASVRLDPANLYRVLSRMRSDGWIEEISTDAPSGAERRRSYALTRLGREVAGAELRRLQELVVHALPALAGGGSS